MWDMYRIQRPPPPKPLGTIGGTAFSSNGKSKLTTIIKPVGLMILSHCRKMYSKGKMCKNNIPNNLSAVIGVGGRGPVRATVDPVRAIVDPVRATVDPVRATVDPVLVAGSGPCSHLVISQFSDFSVSQFSHFSFSQFCNSSFSQFSNFSFSQFSNSSISQFSNSTFLNLAISQFCSISICSM